MPNKFTEHFNLNQWEKTDKVLMDDFNEDNRKIDAALFSHPSAELIDSVTVEEEGQSLELDVSQMDWSRYMALVVIADSARYTGFVISIGSGERCVCAHSGVQSTSTDSQIASLSYASHMTALFPVFYDGNHQVSALSFANGMNGSTGSAAFSFGGRRSPLSESRTMQIKCKNSSFSLGDRAILWGVK